MSTIKFNDPEYAKQRQEVKPLSLEEMEILVNNINHYIGSKEILSIAQRLIWEYENLKHASQIKCQCCYKNTTADIDVNYELVNSKTNG